MAYQKKNTAAQLEFAKLNLDSIRTDSRCLICKSPHRQIVDKLVAAQFSYKSVADELMQRDQEFSQKNPDTVRRNIERHAKNHLDIQNRAVREIVERRAKEQGILIDSQVGKITTGRALLDLLISKATDQAADPEFNVKFADAIEAVKMLEDTQREEYLYELERMQKQVACISQAVKELVPPTLIPLVVNRAEELYENETLALTS